MSFKGDLSTIGLAEVFQMISMSQKEGTLIVQDKDSRKCIFFGASGIRLLSMGKRKGLRVGDLLLRAGKISEQGLNEALENAKIQKKLLGEVLIEGGQVTEEVIQGLVRSQIEEEIYDLFLWQKASFEFVEGSPADELVDPDARVTKLSFDINGLLLEAVRRADEWSLIKKVIPSSDSIFVFSSEGDRQEEEQTASEAFRRVFSLLDGQTSVQDIVDNTGISEFEVSKTLLDLSNRARVRILAVQEMMDLANRRMASGQKELGIRTYQACAMQAPDDPKVIVGVARILEGEKLDREAASNYLKAGRLYMAQGDLDRALDSMRRAAEKDPEDLEVKTGIFEVYAAAGNLDEGKKLAKELVHQAMMLADNARARALCDRLLNADPEDLDFRISRARILHRMNLKAELEKDLEYIKKNMPVDPKENARIQAALQEITGRPMVASGTGSGPRVVRRAGGGPGKKVAIAVLVLLLAGAGFAGKFEMDARKELAATESEARGLAAAKKHEEALARAGAFLKGKYSLSPWQKEKAQALLSEIAREKEQHDAKTASDLTREQEAALEEMARMLRDYEGGDPLRNPKPGLERAQALLARAEAAEKRPFRKKEEIAAYRKRAGEELARLKKHLEQAQKRRQEAERLEKDGKFAEAAKAVDALIQDFPNTDAATDVRFPVQVVTRPAGVRVTNLRAEAEKRRLGETPLVARFSPSEGVFLQFEKDGYGSKTQALPSKLIGTLTVTLDEKLEKWVLPGVASQGAPVFWEDLILVASGNRVTALQAGRLKWRSEPPLEGRIIGAPCRVGNSLVLGTSEGWVAVLELRRDEGRVLWKDKLEGRLTAAPAGLPEGLVAAPVAGRGLQTYALNGGARRARLELPGDVLVDPVVAEGRILLACDEGTVLAVDGEGKARWKVVGPRLPGALAAMAGGGALVAAGDQLCALGPQRVLWRRSLPSTASGAPVQVGAMVYALTRDGRLLAFAGALGEARGTLHETRSPVEGGLARAGPLLLWGADDQGFYAFDTATGAALWRYKASTKLRSIPGTDGKVVVFGGEDILYALELD